MNKIEVNDRKDLKALEFVIPPDWLKVFAKMIFALFILIFVLLTFTPWQQTSQGSGVLTAIDPNDRVQNITSTVPGTISNWMVRDGSVVKKGEPIVEIVDNDPNFISRLKIERDAVYKKYLAAKAASDTALINVERQMGLYKQGLSAKAKVEKSRIEYKKLLSAEATAAANLAKAEVRLSRQQNQVIVAPRDGTILRVLHGSGSVYVREGDVLATFVPDSLKPAVEVFISGNDLPLVYPGRHVRLQFEGWPAVQFSGWPSLAIGTFGGVVSLVDPSAGKQGKFRVLVVPEDGSDWPSKTYLRQGTRVFAWILLNEVKLGYELWRQLNGFPPNLDNEPDLIDNSKDENKKKKKDKDKEYKELYK